MTINNSRVIVQGSKPPSAGTNFLNNPLLIILLLAAVAILIITVIILVIIYRMYKQKTVATNKEAVEITSITTSELIDDAKTTTIKEKTLVVKKRPTQYERLTIEEQAVIDILIEKQGNILQKHLPKLTNYSKSTITRIISRLEDKDVIYRVPAGRGYRVFLKSMEEKNEE